MNFHTAAVTGPVSTSGQFTGRAYAGLAMGSVLVSAWLIVLDPLVSTQAISILRKAQLLLGSGTAAAIDAQGLGPWCVAAVHQLTGWSLLTSARVFSGMLHVLLCLAFVSTVNTLGGNWRLQVWASVLVLAHPLLGDFRSNLSGEPGYWVFLLLALRQLLIYARAPGWRVQLIWFSSVVMAALFRVEALVLANLAPLILLLALPRRRRLGAVFRLLLPLWALTAVLVFSGGLAALALFQGTALPGSFADLTAVVKAGGQLPAGVAGALPQLAQGPDQGWAVAGGLLGIMFASLARATTIVCLLLLLLGWWQGSLRAMPTPGRSLVNAHLGAIVGYLAAVALLGDLVSPRAVAPAVLLLMLYLPFVLDGMWQRGWRVLALSALLIVASAGLYNRKFEFQHVADAATWVREHTPEQASLFSNSAYLRYFAQRPGTVAEAASLAQLLEHAHWQEYALLALHLQGSAFAQWYELSHNPQLQLLQVFTNHNRDTVVVLKNNAVEPPR